MVLGDPSMDQFLQNIPCAGPAALWLVNLGNFFKPGVREFGYFFRDKHKKSPKNLVFKKCHLKFFHWPKIIYFLILRYTFNFYLKFISYFKQKILLWCKTRKKMFLIKICTHSENCDGNNIIPVFNFFHHWNCYLS